MTIESEKKGQRVSITKSQRESQVGAELLALCQSVTSDGKLAEEEVSQIRTWLSENRETDLPAVMFLIPIVERILEDGIVTESERRELFIGIERVLPQDVRGISRAARISLEKAEKEQQRAAKQAEKVAKREEKERNRALAHFDFMVAGTRYEGRSKIIGSYVDEGDTLFLVRDPRNAHSKYAIEISIDRGDQIGFVPEDHAVDLAPLLDSGHKYTASVKKLLTGGRSPIPVAVVDVYRNDSNMVRNSSHGTSNKAHTPRGLLTIIIAVVVIGLLIRTCSS